MKNYLFIMSAIILMASCNTKHDGGTVDSSKVSDSAKIKSHNVIAKCAATDTLITLNGIGWRVADTMQKHFMKYRSQDNNPIQKSIWFDKLSIHLMTQLLLKEIKQEKSVNKNRTDTTDGIRIYFVSDTTVTSGPLNNSIILVSTQNGGKDLSVPSKAFHKDYFSHQKNDPLFKNLSAINGAPATRSGSLISDGQNLYHGFYFRTGDDSSCSDTEHYISRRRAHKMLMEFTESPGPIKTISEWFSLELLEDIDADTMHDGLRIYFTKHPNSYKYFSFKKMRNVVKIDTDSTKEAFVLVTTRYRKFIKPRHADYFSCLSTNGYFELSNVTDWFHKHAPFADGSGGGDGGQDNGEICPSHCN